MFSYRFDWQCDEDPPDVYITAPDGCDVLLVYEQPTYIGGDEDEPTSWKIGPFAELVLSTINMSDDAERLVREMASGVDASQDNLFVAKSVVEGIGDMFKAKFLNSLRQPLSSGSKSTGGTDDK